MKYHYETGVELTLMSFNILLSKDHSHFEQVMIEDSF